MIASYYETETEVNGLLVRHTIHAPEGDAAFVIDDGRAIGSAPASPRPRATPRAIA